MSTASNLRAAGVVSALVLRAASPAWGDTLDTSMPRAVVVGAPRGAAPSERIDPGRTGRARTSLPASPVEIWRRHVSGNIDVTPVVDDAGNVYVALTIPELVKLGPDAKEIWRVRLGGSAPLAPPTLLSDGTLAVVTAAGVAWGFTPSGATRFATSLGIPRRDADTAPLALEGGGLLVAAGNALVAIDADGAVRARAVIDEHGATSERAAGAVIQGPGPEGGALVTTTAGNVYHFRPPAAPRRIGSFGGTTPRGAALGDDRTLIAVVDGRRVVALDLRTGAAHVRSGGIAFDGPPTVGRGGLALVGTPLGLLIAVDAAGNERAHVMLDKPQPPPPAGAPLSNTFVQVELKPSPPVVVDDSGRIAFVRGGGRVGVVMLRSDVDAAAAPKPQAGAKPQAGGAGRVEVASERVCASPISIMPAGDRRILVACHDGGLWMYGE